MTRRGCNKLTQEVGERRVVTFVELDIAKTVCQSDGLEISLRKQTITDIKTGILASIQNFLHSFSLQ